MYVQDETQTIASTDAPSSAHPADLARAQRIRAACGRRRIESASERERVAVALHGVVTDALRGSDVSKGSVYARAGLAHGSDGTSKAARHYEIPPGPSEGIDAARKRRIDGLTKDAARYARLIDALAEMTGTDASTLLVRVFGGTSVENAVSGGWDDPDQDLARRLIATTLSDGSDWLLRQVPELDQVLRFARRGMLLYDAGTSEWRDQASFEPGRIAPSAWCRGPDIHLGRVSLRATPVALRLDREDGSAVRSPGTLSTDAEVWLCVRRDDKAVMGRPDAEGTVPRLSFALSETTYLYADREVIPGIAGGVRVEALSRHFMVTPLTPDEIAVPGGTLVVALPDPEGELDEMGPVDHQARCHGPSYVEATAAGLMELDARVGSVRAGPLSKGASPYAATRSTCAFSAGVEALLRQGFGRPEPEAPEGVAMVRRPGGGPRGPLECLRERAEAMVNAMGRWRNGREARLDADMRDIAAGYRDS